MGTHAEFEEKEFETLANVSFALGSHSTTGLAPPMFSPGQVLERDLGFDFSIYLNPSSTTYKLLFGAYPGPPAPGASAPPAPLPAAAPFVNVFLQYKRPEHFTVNHRQPVWQHTSFLRFEVRSRYRRHGRSIVDHSQLEALDDLAQSGGVTTKVRYACPSVWTRTDLYDLYANVNLIDTCVFVEPSLLSHQVSGAHSRWHNYWTFNPSQPLTTGIPNPRGEMREDAQSGASFSREILTNLETKVTEDFLENVHKTRSFAEGLKSSEYLKAPSDSRGRTKSQFIDDATGSVRNDFLDQPRDDSWLVGPARKVHPRPSRRPHPTELEIISAAVEVAATAKQLDLTWMTATP